MGSTSSMQKSASRHQAVSGKSQTQTSSSKMASKGLNQQDKAEPPAGQSDSVEDGSKMRKDSPHLSEEFDNIDEFIKELKEDPKLENGKYSSSRALSHLGFEMKSDGDRRKLGDYFGVNAAADALNASYEKFLESLGLKCMASVTAAMVQENTKCVIKMSQLRMIVWNNTDASLALAEKVTKAGMLKHFVEDLKILKVEDVTTEDDDLDNTFESAISVLQNCSRNPVTRQTLRDYNTVTHLLPFLKCKSEEGRLQTLFTLANLVDETENEVLLADDTVFDSLFEILQEAWDDYEHRHIGFSVEELVDGMTGLAKNDSNKTVLREKGAVPILMKIMENGSEQEKEHAVKCVWELAFDKTNKQGFLANEDLMKLLGKLKKSAKKVVSKAAEGALWVINLVDKAHSPTDHETSERRSGGDASSRGHVMISYQWSDQKMILKVRNTLRQNGFTVWMDIDNMGGSTLQAMAEAVQNAAVVLVCMSDRYKLSQNCRSEAEYAFSLEKTIVPLLMQRGYKADGWLGIIKGTKLFFDFSGKYPYEQKAADLMRELGYKGKQKQLITDVPDGELPIIPVIQSAPLQAARGQSVTSWSQKDVHNWLTKIGLQNNSSLQSLTGDNLVFLHDVSQRAPEFFFTYARTDLQLTSLDDLMTFSRAVDKL